VNRKIILQLFIIALMTSTSIIFYRTYFLNNSKKAVEVNNKTENKIVENIEENKNIIENFEYSVKNLNNDEYNITSKEATIDLNNPDLIYMKDVIAIMQTNKSPNIYIYSDNALFNKRTYETNFDTNVLIEYDIHEIKSDKLDFFLKENLVTISDNIKYKDVYTELLADKIKINLITKDAKIFMNNKTEKIKTVTLN
jgi:lipopolysaccharide export system protein LptA